MALAGEISVRIGADNSQLRAKLADSEKAIDGTFQKLQKAGIGVASFAIVQRTFSELVEHAQSLEGPLTINQQHAKSFAEQLARARTFMLDIGVEALGVVNRFGDWIGRQIAILKYGREQVELAENIRAEAEANISAIEKARVAEEQKLKVKSEIAKLDKSIADAIFKQQGLAEQRNALEEKYLGLVKEAINAGPRTLAGLEKLKQSKETYIELQRVEAALQKENAQAVEKSRAALDQLAREKESQMDEEARRNVEIARLMLKGVENLTDAEKVQLDILTKRVTQRQVEAQIALYLARGVENLTDKEKAHLAALAQIEFVQKNVTAEVKTQTGEMQKQIDLARTFVSITGRGSKELTDRELERKIDILRSDLQRRREANFQRPGDPMLKLDPMLQLQERDLASSIAELDFRNNVRRTAAFLGEEAAFRQFSGLSESRFREILSGAVDTNNRLLKGIESLNRKLDDGIDVRPIGR